MAADWSQLPKDLLHQISERLHSPIYLLRLRSVCSSWRSSLSPFTPLHKFPLNFPPLSDENKSSTFIVSKRTLFLISPPPQQPIKTPILVQIGQDLTGRIRLYSPLYSYQHLPLHSSRVLDFYNLPVSDIGNVFVFHRYPSPNVCGGDDPIYRKKVVAATVSSPGKGNREGYILLTIHKSGKLAFFRRGENSWNLTPEMPTPFDDVCVFNGRPCAVDCTGWTIAVGSGPYLELVAGPLLDMFTQPVFGVDKKYLVESEGELLLVDKHISSTRYENGFLFSGERVVRFDVFRLDLKAKKWVKVFSLGDRVLFLGDACSFSASASDLRVGKGGCVIFEDWALKGGVGVFHLDVGGISLLSDHPDYSSLFNYNRLIGSGCITIDR